MTATKGQDCIARGCADAIETGTDNSASLLLLTLTPTHARRLRAVLLEELERVEVYKRTTPRAYSGYHGMLEDIQSDLCDVYEQIISARAAELVGV